MAATNSTNVSGKNYHSVYPRIHDAKYDHPAVGKTKKSNGLTAKELKAENRKRAEQQYRHYILQQEQRQRIQEEVQDVDFSE